MDGWVIIGTKMDSKQLEKDLKQTEKRLKQYENEAEKLTKRKVKAEMDLSGYEEEKRLIQQMVDEQNEYAQSKAEVNNNLNIEKVQLEELNQKYSKQLNNLETINSKIVENAKNQELMKNQIEETRKKLAGIDVDFSKIGNSITKTVKKVGRWGLAIFSVRSAYMAVRRAMSTLSQYNDELADKLNTIILVFASALEPIVTHLVDLVYRLLTYVNYIAKAWFNVDLFASASAKAMKSSEKSAEKMQKSLAGFDEMNVISDNSSSGSSASGGASFVPPEDVPIPSWIEWIANNKDLVIGALAGIGAAILLLNLGGLITSFSGLGTILAIIWGIIKPLLIFIGTNAVVIGGIIAIVGGLAIAIKGLINYLKEPTWENFGLMLAGIGIIAAGVLIIFGGFPALIVLIIGAIVALGVAIYKNWDSIVKFTKELVEKIKNAFGKAIDWIKEKFNAMISFFSNLISKIVNLFKTIGTKVGDTIGSAFKTVINGVLKAIESILNTPIKTINGLINVINKVPGIDLNKLPTFSLPRLAVGGIVNNPGRGVPIGGAIAGEVSREGVIPLTDSQAMEELGRSIGRYITINANITNTMNGRVISRELQKINNNSDFARNV